MSDNIAVRPFGSLSDYRGMIDYFHDAPDELLLLMGVDREKLPPRELWLARAWQDHHRSEREPTRERFYLAWVLNESLVGHSSINQIRWGKEAFAHLHLWRSDLRRAGMGMEFFQRSVSVYFERFGLSVLRVEPCADNPGPNRVLERLGFMLVRRYRTTPGPIAFEQEVNRYEMDRERWRQLRERIAQ